MHFGVRLTPVVSTGPLGQGDSLSLSFTPVLKVVTGYLQGHPQKHVLFSYRLPLELLPQDEVSNVGKAIENAEAFARELIARITTDSQEGSAS